MALDVKKPKGLRKSWNGGEPPDIGLPTEVLYVVAVSFPEARLLAAQIGHNRRSDAEKHLREVCAPPTDPDYAKQYRIFIVETKR